MQPAINILGWIRNGLNAGTVITLVTITFGLVAAHGHDRERMDDLERRIGVAEAGGVRRAEMDARDKSMTEVLQSIDARLATIERALMEGRK